MISTASITPMPLATIDPFAGLCDDGNGEEGNDLQLVVDGAKEHGLPAEYVRQRAGTS